MTSQQQKFEIFKQLHQYDKIFAIPNPWDAGSARILTAMGFKALATTSAGHAFSTGKCDGIAALSRDDILKNAAEIVNATDLPVSCDLENGFGNSPEECALTIKLAIETGLVGGSIEDATTNIDKPIYDFNLAIDRIHAACEARKNQPFILTARAENFLYGINDIDDTIKRLQAFEKAGADVLFAPDLPDIAAIKTICQSLSKPVNVVMGLNGNNYSIKELQQAGVTRVSTGGSLARSSFGALIQAGDEIINYGTFNYAADAISHKDITEYMT